MKAPHKEVFWSLLSFYCFIFQRLCAEITRPLLEVNKALLSVRLTVKKYFVDFYQVWSSDVMCMQV